MVIKIEERELRTQQIASIRVTTNMAEIKNVIGEIYSEVMTYLQKIGTFPSGAPLALYHSFDETSMDLEAGFPIANPIPEEGRIKSNELPTGKAAYAIHLGSYDTLEETYTAIQAWMKENGKEIMMPSWEVYLTDPTAEPDTSKWKTEIFWPFKE